MAPTDVTPDGALEVLLQAPFRIRPAPGSSEAETADRFSLSYDEETAEWSNSESSSPKWSEPRSEWKLPLYHYPPTLDRDMRDLLPGCFAEWTDPGWSANLEPTSVVDKQTFELCQPSVALWRPNFLLVTVRTRLTSAIKRYSCAYDVIDKLAGEMWSLESGPLQDLVERALATESEHPSIAKLRRTCVSKEPLWIFGMAYPRSAGTRPLEIDESESSVKQLGPIELYGTDGPGLVAIITPCRSTDAQDSADVAEATREVRALLSVQNVVWAAAVDYDRSLLKRIATMRSNTSGGKPKELEREIDKIVSLFYLVARFQGGLDSLETHLTRRAHRSWEAVDEAWGLGSYLVAIDKKMQTLVNLHSEVTMAVSSNRARRLGETAFAFTSLGVVTVGLGVLGFFLTDVDEPAPPLPYAVGLVIALFSGAFAVFWYFRRSG